jgi:hypothetical protein
MEKSKADKLIDRIEDAKDWLEKAKVEYKNSNPERGGLILNLAQAEVKHAWELSREQYVSNTVTQLNHEPKHHSKLKYIIPVAASLVLVTSLGVGVRLSGIFSPALKSKAVPQVSQTNHKATLRNEKIETVSQTSSSASLTGLTQHGNDVVTQTNPTPSRMPVVQSVTNMNSTNKQLRYADSVLNRTETNITDSKPVLKAVSKLSIDEDALTKEASHSLRIGK